MKEFADAGWPARLDFVFHKLPIYLQKWFRKGILIPLCLLAFIPAFSQTVTLKAKELPLTQVLEAVKQQTGYHIFYNKGMMDNTVPVTADVKNMSLKAFLQLVLTNQPLEARYSEKSIFFSEKKTVVPSSQNAGNGPAQNDLQQETVISGKVMSVDGKPLPGITVKILPSRRGTLSAEDGTFLLPVTDRDEKVSLSGIGLQSISVSLSKLRALNNGKMLKNADSDVLRTASGLYIFKMQSVALAMKEVEVINTGMFTRRQESFTGITHTMKGNELRSVNRQSILEAISTLDPSFRIIRDNNLGSDPNQLPQIEFRGTRSMPSPTAAPYNQQLRLQYEQDPNRPLFILDGFEATLQDVMQLDINRIAAVTLLKDAASTALYGRRSANGVVVIETIKPTPGKLNISYTFTGSLAVPDLSGYNMMNSTELFQFQQLSGKLYPENFGFTDYELGMAKRNARSNETLRGVNSYWLSVPLRNAFSPGHNLTIQGGDGTVNYMLGVNMNRNNGVMKESYNRATGGFATLTYRRGKINITNTVRFTGGRQQGSPYGRFSDYVKLPPYYRKYDEQKQLNMGRYLEDIAFVDASGTNRRFLFGNPLYNASLPTKNVVNTSQLTNSLGLNWDILPSLRLSANGQFQKNDNTADYFISPLNTSFDNTKEGEKGAYNFQRTISTAYNGNVTLTYNRIFNDKHILTVNTRADMSRADGSSTSVTAVGYASTAQPLLFLAGAYQPNSMPTGGESNTRSVGFTASANYSYDNRYNLDLSYNTSGSNSFGSDRLFASFYSLGVGWNIGRESFFMESDIVNDLRLTANFGLTGNEATGGFSSRTTYRLGNISFRNEEAVTIASAGNPNLEWGKTYKVSYGVQGVFFKRKLSLSLSGYTDKTTPMIIPLLIPPSTGSPSIPTSIGTMNTVGMDLDMNYRVVNTKNWTWNLGIKSPLFLRSTYSGLEAKLNGLSKMARDSGYLLRYKDGSGPFDIWAVRSVGIDPTTGREIFLDKNGSYTFDFNTNNEMKVGINRPVLQGNINTQIRYKRFSLAIYCRYVMGELKFNTALYNKVENISGSDFEQNQDRRALYERWKQPGDDASYLAINNTTLGISDRFLQKENAVYFESVALNYDFNSLLRGYASKKLGISRLDLSLNLNDFFRFQLSNLRLERGLDYPFARNASFTLSVGF
ncbi:SusC/RagA family TonB-linked outer membrane protein [Chitinophaga polysaccharea]|uniref:SusC/RagA family TonB-linked outer membrane protein n=1 Tax=Chitinophaga polysaccharea TaxID=1293035 RepID=UPI00115B63CA|nr:SusC/RagA family TonB-linked outer membrane protein [Chitinophaga polysaccharea]